MKKVLLALALLALLVLSGCTQAYYAKIQADKDQNAKGAEANCVAEGGSTAVSPAALPCCEGLSRIGCDKPTVDGYCEEALCVGGVFCVKPGDGICGPGENKCNATEDCLKEPECQAAADCKQKYPVDRDFACDAGLCRALSPTGGTAVQIQDSAFVPAELTVEKGFMVSWVNNDSVTHTVTSDMPGLFDSGQLSQNQTFSKTFNETGTFNYHCSIHPSMTGKIIVVEKLPMPWD